MKRPQVQPTALRSIYKRVYSSYKAVGEPAAVNAAALIARASGRKSVNELVNIKSELAHPVLQVNVFVG